jgi:hypothetical protein
MVAHGLPTVPQRTDVREHHWRIRGAALAIGVAVFALGVVADWVLFASGYTMMDVIWVSDAMAGCLAGLFALKLMHEAQLRRELIAEQSEVIAETNHHIRNALEIIQFSAQSTGNEQVKAQVSSAVDRIHWVLRELSGESQDSKLVPVKKK